MNNQQLYAILHALLTWAWLIFAAFAVVTALVLFVAFWEYTVSKRKIRETGVSSETWGPFVSHAPDSRCQRSDVHRLTECNRLACLSTEIIQQRPQA
jgi:hypothetical protein